MNELSWTGERLVTSIKNVNVIEHLHRYAIAMSFVENKTVLDIACGEGYGSNLMASKAKKVIGVDIASEAIEHAKSKYKNSKLEFLQGSASEIPLPDKSIDIIVSFETIEHHDKHNEMMREFNRVLKVDGLLIISSPDKKYYTDLREYKNPFHVKELYKDEFDTLIKQYFKNTLLLKQGYCWGTLVYPESHSSELLFFKGDFNEIGKSEDLLNPEYNIIIATNNAAEELKYSSSFFESTLVKEQYDELANKYVAAFRELQILKRSKTYKLGKLLVSPFQALRRLFK